MILKLIGALLVVVSCGGVGFSMAANHRKEVLALQCLIAAIDRIINELEYKLKPLPELLLISGNAVGGIVGDFFLRVSKELRNQKSPNATDCFAYVLSETFSLPEVVRVLLVEMGSSIGQFDADGQINGLSAIREQAKIKLNDLTSDIDKRLRSYQTLGVCAGAAIAILFV